jgi:hypothetical protein
MDVKWDFLFVNMYLLSLFNDRLCRLVVRVPGFDSRRYQIFSEVVGLQRDPLSLLRIIEELLQGISGSDLGNRD